MARQQVIKGVERESIAEVDDAAEAYVEARDTRMKKTEREVAAKDALVAVMRKHDLSVYKDRAANLIVTLVPGKDGVKVTEAKGPDEDEPDDSDA